MASTEWWQRGPIDGIPAVLQPVAHILFQVRESVDELVDGLSQAEWNARPAGVASAAFHVRHLTGVVDRLFTYARGESLSEDQFAALRSEGRTTARHGCRSRVGCVTRSCRRSRGRIADDRRRDTWGLSRCGSGATAVHGHWMPGARSRTCDASRRAALGDDTHRPIGQHVDAFCGSRKPYTGPNVRLESGSRPFGGRPCQKS
jgi:hypothetical protein